MHALAYDRVRPDALARSRARRRWTPELGPLPSLYLSHGAPPLLDDAGWIEALGAWADRLPHPRGIVVVSAHWESAPVALSNPAAGAPLVYDFGGFAPRYSTLTYPSPDAHDLAARVSAVLPDDTVATTTSRGLDHGAWVPLLAMYPAADVPVVALSLPSADPQRLLALGARLRALRAEGVLVVGSGFLTHGLPFLDRDALAGRTVPGWSRDFDAWAAEALGGGRTDVEALARFREAPGMPWAHPTVEHWTPLFVALGAADDPEAPVTTTVDGMWWGLSRRSFQAA